MGIPETVTDVAEGRSETVLQEFDIGLVYSIRSPVCP